MSFWSGELLEQRARAEKIITPFVENQIDCNAYTLRMGREAYVTPDAKDGHDGKKKVKHLSENEHFIIPSGQFAWLLTKEFFRIPKDTMAFISLRTTYKFKGLINVSGFHVDPGFEGHLVYAVFNAGPQEIRLSENEDLFLIWFASLDKESEKVRKKPALKRIETKFLVPGEILSLQSASEEISRLKTKTDHIVLKVGGLVVLLTMILQILLRTDSVKKLIDGFLP
tara:strand:- start:366 stop:1043 length:678 start_codon:yes stop_codon:yes gene_type:complete